MFRSAVTQTQFVGDLANTVFGRVSGNEFRGDVSFVSTLRALVFPRMPEEDKIYFQYSEANYPKRTVETANWEAVMRAITNVDRGRSPGNGNIMLYNCCSYATEDNDAMLDVIEQNIHKYFTGFTKIEKVSEFFKKTFRALCYINPESKTVMLFCGGLDLKKMHFLQLAIPVMLPWYFDPNSGVTEQEMEVLQSFRDKSAQRYIDAIAALAQKYDFRAMKIKSDLGGFETRFLTRELETVNHSIERKMRDIESYEREINKMMRECYDLNIRLLGLHDKIAEGGESSDIVDYFLCNKNLYLVSVNDSELSFVCKGYLEYYDEEVVRKYLDKSTSILYRPDNRDMSDRISPADIKLLMTAIFIDQTLRMKFCAAYRFDLRGSVRAESGYGYGSDFNDCTPNTHIDRFSCLGNHARAINDQLKNNNYIGAIEQCISSCKSLNFADSAVISEFMRRIYGTGSHVNMRCIELPDGTVVNQLDAIKWLKEQNEQKKKEQEAAKAAEAEKEEAHE